MENRIIKGNWEFTTENATVSLDKKQVEMLDELCESTGSTRKNVLDMLFQMARICADSMKKDDDEGEMEKEEDCFYEVIELKRMYDCRFHLRNREMGMIFDVVFSVANQYVNPSIKSVNATWNDFIMTDGTEVDFRSMERILWNVSKKYTDSSSKYDDNLALMRTAFGKMAGNGGTKIDITKIVCITGKPPKVEAPVSSDYALFYRAGCKALYDAMDDDEAWGKLPDMSKAAAVWIDMFYDWDGECWRSKDDRMSVSQAEFSLFLNKLGECKINALNNYASESVFVNDIIFHGSRDSGIISISPVTPINILALNNYNQLWR